MLDWSIPGLEQTLDALRAAGIPTVGAGRNLREAWSPASIPTSSGSRVLVLAAGAASSGVPPERAADDARPGVAFLADLSEHTISRIAAMVRTVTQADDVVVMSVHWGPNWGYEITPEHRRFARALIDRAGVHVIHSHSSHHPLGIEVHRGRLILYGCGDLLTDYEGIQGHEHYRGELGVLYFPAIETSTGTLKHLELVPTQMERFRLNRPAAKEVQWLAATLDRDGAPLGTTVTMIDQETLLVGW